MNETKECRIATVVLSGWGDKDNSVAALIDDLQSVHKNYLRNKGVGVFRFFYNYSVENKYLNKFARFDELKNRFRKYLENTLLKDDI